MQGKLSFEKMSRFDRIQEPCNIAVPFAEGVLDDASRFVIYDTDRAVPTQAVATSHWPDGSIKWLYADFLADLPANRGKDFSWHVDSAAAQPPEPAAAIVDDGNNLRLTSGAADIHLGAPGGPPLAGLAMAASRFHADELTGPILLDAAGVEWTATLDANGWRVLRPGPVHVIVEARGVHRSAAHKSLLDFQLRLHAFAGKPWFQLDYRLINREATPEVIIHGLRLSLRAAGNPGPVTTAVGHSNYGTSIERGNETRPLACTIDAEYLLFKTNEQLPEVHFGTFWADWSEPGRRGLGITFYQAQQNFPKAFNVNAAGMDAWLYPDASPPLCFRQGVARTQRLLLHAHDGDPEAAEVNIRSLQFQMPDRPTLPRETYRHAGVFEDIWVDGSVRRVEAALRDAADYRIRAYGLLNWGDGPDDDYSNQGRGMGKPVWTNNEYDLPHAAMLLFAHTGERRMLDYLLVTGEHQMDVDVCHFSPDPLRQGGQILHTAHHVTGACTPSHEWVDGLLDLYHVTADPEVLETALGIGENVMRHLERPIFRNVAATAARETGWALRSLLALYRETHDPRWLEPAGFIVRQFTDWQREYGGWLAPYTDHTLVRVPFMIAIAAASLMRYYWLTSDTKVGAMIVNAMRDLLDNALMPDGRFYYKELPSLHHRQAGLYVLESLAYAYDISGDAAFLKAGLPTFEDVLRVPVKGNGAKYVIDDAVIWQKGPSPKNFASCFLPVMMFYRAAVAAGLIEPE